MNKQKTNEWLDSLACQSSPDIEECIDYLGDTIDWLYQLKNVPQDPDWHAEGNVHIHTNCVLSELYRILDSEASHIQGRKRQILILGALLHDIGKTTRTREVEIRGVMRIASPQHESVGRSYLAFKLMELSLPFAVVWHVLGLVGEHHMPKLLVARNQSKGSYLSLSRRANLELLYCLEVADMRGRVCQDVESQLEHLELFKMFAEDYGVWQEPHNLKESLSTLIELENEPAKDYIYATALSEIEKSVIALPVEALARSYAYKNDHAKLVVLCGPSGSGKSNWVARHCRDYVLISLDEIREEINGDRSSQKNRGQVLHLAKDRLKECLRKKRNVVWDATNLRADFRKIICDFGCDYHALVSLVVFLLAESTIYRSNRNRQYAIPDGALSKQIDSFQFPLPDEAHQLYLVGDKGQLLHHSGHFYDVDEAWATFR